METEIQYALNKLKTGEELEEYQLVMIANSRENFSDHEEIIKKLEKKIDFVTFKFLKLQRYLDNKETIEFIRMGVYDTCFSGIKPTRLSRDTKNQRTIF